MKIVLITITAIMSSFNAMAINGQSLNGQEFVDCFKKALNHTISESFSEEQASLKKNQKNVKRICRSLSTESYQSLKNDFVERDEENKLDVPFESDDMLADQLINFYKHFSESINCYKPYGQKGMKIPTVVKRVTAVKNAKLTKLALQKMINIENSEEFDLVLEKSMGEFDLAYCQSK